MIVTRIAPSPTGHFHIGGARTALFNYLFAKHSGGKFILRIEDTDKARSRKEYEEDIIASLKWLGIDFDEVYRQSERKEIYRKIIEKLIDSDKAFISDEESKQPTGKGGKIIRLRNPNKKVMFTDNIRGDITFDTEELGDFVIARGVEDPLYHLASVIDDAEMNITNIIRGEDHISNTPRQILIQEALGYKRPEYAHIPLILAPDRSKLSKRKGGATINEYIDRGYLPEALINYLALLGWNPGTDREYFTLDELVKSFSIEKIQKGGATFNTDKLDWFNTAYIKKLDVERLVEEIPKYLPEDLKREEQYSEERLRVASPFLIERISHFNELADKERVRAIDFFFKQPEYQASMLIPKKDASIDPLTIRAHLIEVSKRLSELEEKDFTEENVKKAMFDYAEEKGKGAVLWPMRMALSGKERSPNPLALATVFGKKETLSRLAIAITKLENA